MLYKDKCHFSFPQVSLFSFIFLYNRRGYLDGSVSQLRQKTQLQYTNFSDNNNNFKLFSNFFVTQMGDKMKNFDMKNQITYNIQQNYERYCQLYTIC